MGIYMTAVRSLALASCEPYMHISPATIRDCESCAILVASYPCIVVLASGSLDDATWILDG